MDVQIEDLFAKQSKHFVLTKLRFVIECTEGFAPTVHSKASLQPRTNLRFNALSSWTKQSEALLARSAYFALLSRLNARTKQSFVLVLLKQNKHFFLVNKASLCDCSFAAKASKTSPVLVNRAYTNPISRYKFSTLLSP